MRFFGSRAVCFFLQFFIFCCYPIIAQWSPPIRISEPGCDYYPQLLASGDTLHAVYPNCSGGSKISYVRSTDSGENWSPHRVLSDTVNTYGTIFPRIMKCGSKLMAMWAAVFEHGVRRANIGYSISNNNGLSWTDPSYVLSPNWDYYYYFTASNADSLVNVTICLGLVGDDIFIYNVRSTDFGQSWSSPMEIFHPYRITGNGDQASFANYVHFVWSGSFDEEDFGLYYTRSIDGGITWSENIDLIENEDWWEQHPAIAVNHSGVLGVTWIGIGNVQLRISYDSGENWTPTTQVPSNNTARNMGDIVLFRNTIMVTWEDSRFSGFYYDAIFFNKSSDGGQSWGEEYWLDRDTSRSWNPSLAAASKDKIFAIWYDGRDDADSYCGLYFSRWPYETGLVENEEDNFLPQKIAISAYPNPFNSSTTIEYKVQQAAHVTIEIHDLLGHRVEEIVNDWQQAGQYQATWNADDYSSGIYFYKIRAGKFVETKKMLLLK